MTKKPTAGVILAAGQSVRFGQPKQLIELKGKTLIQRILATALESQLDQCILVLGFEHQKIIRVLGKLTQNQRIQVVINHDYRQGQSRSLKVGLLEAKDTFPSVMFLVADQPMLDAATIDLLLDQFWQSPRNICVSVCKGHQGNPTIFSNTFYERLLQIEGDTGARQIIKAHPADVLPVEVNNPLSFFDIDTPQDLEKLNALLR
jgi:molybdenum cofactor cytidylyltransferase